MESVALESMGEEDEVDDAEMLKAFAAADEANDEVEAVAADVEELEEIETGLESIAGALDSSLETGGIDPVAAKFAHLAVDAHMSRVGLESSQAMPALEDFAGETSAEASTKVAIEGIGDTLKKIWDAIKLAAKKVMESISDFFAKMFSSLESFKKKVEGLKETYKTLDAKALKKDAKLKVANPDTLKHKGKLDDKAVLAGSDAVSDLSGAGVSLMDIFTTITGSQRSKVTDILKGKEASTADFEKIASEGGKALTASNIKGVLPGDKTVKTVISGTSVKFTIETIPKSKSIGKAVELSPISPKDSLKVLDNVLVVIDELEKLKKINEELKKEIVAFAKELDVVAKKADASFYENLKGGLTANKILALGRGDALKSAGSLQSYLFKTARGYMRVMEDNMNLYTGGNGKEATGTTVVVKD